jgi:hypothetical protein
MNEYVFGRHKITQVSTANVSGAVLMFHVLALSLMDALSRRKIKFSVQEQLSRKFVTLERHAGRKGPILLFLYRVTVK